MAKTDDGDKAPKAGHRGPKDKGEGGVWLRASRRLTIQLRKERRG
jgi:hypothetical protein